MVSGLRGNVNHDLRASRAARGGVYITLLVVLSVGPVCRNPSNPLVSHKKRSAKAKSTPPSQPSPDRSPVVHQRDKLDWTLTIRERNDLREKQMAIRDLILHKDAKVIFINGPAGTSKTWLAVYCGLLLLQQRRISHITFIRTLVESASKGMGYLPGDQSQKMDPYLMPMMDKLEELLSSTEVKRLITEQRAIGLPVNFLRGASLNAQYIVLEEAQNFTVKELTTALTRIGQYSKLVIIGDDQQSDINGASGFQPLFDWFNQPSYQADGIHCVSLNTDDIVRSGIVRKLVEALEEFRNVQRKTA